MAVLCLLKSMPIQPLINLQNRPLNYVITLSIGGYFVETNEKFQNGKKILNHLWVFENLKTKKGCDSYFSGWCK